jgi:hypothetical protein
MGNQFRISETGNLWVSFSWRLAKKLKHQPAARNIVLSVVTSATRQMLNVSDGSVGVIAVIPEYFFNPHSRLKHTGMTH